jgi:CBS domain-containing protein
MKAKEIMTASPSVCSSTDSLETVARLMRDKDCGAVPIVDSGRVVGIITDRDIAIRAIADGKAAGAKVGDIMTAAPQCCGPDDDISEVERVMSERQVRRIPIVDASGRCVGIVSQADLAMASSKNSRVTDQEVAIVVQAISEPSGVQDRGGLDHRM